jgi:catechol 2,3-dioxygenase-like lactoylglutathione lyase family enzyme
VKIEGIDHVQLAIPVGEEDRAREFYGDLLGLAEVPKPAELAGRGGCWFELGNVHVHIGVEADFHPARKAHVAFKVDEVRTLGEAARAAGYEVKDDDPIPGVDRIFVFDPFGNRLEFQALPSPNG